MLKFRIDSEDEGEVQAWILAFLAFPSNEFAREHYVSVLRRAYATKSFEEMQADKIVERASKRIIFQRCVAAQIYLETMASLHDGRLSDSETQIIKRRHLRRFREVIKTRASDDAIWNAIWTDSLPVLHLAEPVRQILEGASMVPHGAAMLPVWGKKAATQAELHFFSLAEAPILGFDPMKAWRIGPKSYEGATVKPLNGEPERVLLSDFPERLLITGNGSPPDTTRKQRDRSPKLYSRREPYFVKTVRDSDVTPNFDWEYGARLLGTGVSPLVMPDANVVGRMLEFMQKFSEWDDISGSGLDEIFQKLREGPTAYFCPYLAYAEWEISARKPMQRAVDILFEHFAPEITNENPGEISGSDEDGSPARTPFSALSNVMQVLVGPAYLVFLRATLIKTSMSYLPGSGKYFALINYLSARANLIPGIEAEVAKHLFFERTPGKQYGKYCLTSKQIRGSFFKSANIVKKIKDVSMNAARDISYIRAAANLYSSSHDQWILTCYQGIDALFRTVYWRPQSLGIASEEMCAVDYQERQEIKYWREVDAVSCWISEARKNIAREPSDDRLRSCIVETESELTRYFPLS